MTRRPVVDANRVYSALLRDGETRRAMMTAGAILFAPRFLRMEMEKHKAEIVRRSGASTEEVDSMLAVLYRRISWIGDEEIRAQLADARDAIGVGDPKDVPYLGCALAIAADAIWSSDPGFAVQGRVPRVSHPDAPIA